MSLATNVSNLATRVATEAKALRTLINGNAADLTALNTTAAPYTTGPARACDWLADARVLLGAIAAVVTPLPADVLTPLADNDVDPQVLAAAVANAIPPGIAALVADELTRRLAT